TVLPDLPAAASALPARARALLAIGRQDLGPFAGRADVWFLIRSVEPPTGPLPPDHALVTARGPFPVADEVALLTAHRITVVVAKNSGGGDAKLEAARRLSLPVLLVQRPPPPPGDRAATVAEALAWLDARR
ncbi:MAG TPA: precorrin-6A/cobalt-precorrin-6A reductase, partial [Azospirillum sp.]